jgi:hypothetical protein
MLDHLHKLPTTGSASGGRAEPTIGWPPGIAASETQGSCIVRFVAVLQTDLPTSVSLHLQVTISDAIALDEHRWTFGFDTEDGARRAADWIGRHPRDASAACRIGTEAAFADFDCLMRVRLVQEQLKAEEDERERRRLREEADRRSVSIDSFLVDAGGQFGLDLRRFGAKTGFWRIMFRERWERERFRDWFRLQRARFEEFAVFLDEHDAVALERQLLAEMLDTERRIKAAGRGAGGRRPLRFWRGE